MPIPMKCCSAVGFALVALFFVQSIDAQGQFNVKRLIDEATTAYRNQDFQLGLDRYSEALEKGSQEKTVAYNAACCAALLGKKELSFDLIDKAIDLGWLDSELLQSDSDLNSLREDKRWAEVRAKLNVIVQLNEKRWNNPHFRSDFVDNLSDADKAAGLSKVWAEVKFNFVNFHLVPNLDWDAEYRDLMPKVLATESTLEYYRLLEKFVAKLRDGHTNVYLPEPLHSKFNARPDIRTRLIEGRVIIVRVLDPKLKEKGIAVGQEVLKINGQPVTEFAEEKILPYMAASTPQDLETRIYERSLFRGPLSEKIQIELATVSGETRTVELARTSKNRLSRFLNRPVPFSMKILDGNVAYLRLESFGTNRAAKEFEKAFEQIEKTDGLVLDLRENGGGNSQVGWEILGYLTDKPFDTTRWHTLQYRPTYRAWNRQPLSKFGSTNEKFNRISKHCYEKPVVMLIGPRTFSAAEDMAAAFDMLGRGKIIGRPSGGSTGQPLMFDLPGGGRARVCTKHDSYADGTEFVGVGIQPDILVTPKVQDVIDGVDRTLNAALEALSK